MANTTIVTLKLNIGDNRGETVKVDVTPTPQSGEAILKVKNANVEISQ